MLRAETDTAHEKIDELNAKVKTLELSSTSKDQEITSLTHRNELLEKKLEEYEEKLEKLKGLEHDESGARGERESLLRKVALLEEEAEQNDKQLKETTEKYAKRVFVLSNGLGFVRSMSRPNTSSAK